MDVKNTEAWNTAEWQYGALHADRMIPFLRGPLDKAEIVERLRRIVRGCPEFYPATLELIHKMERYNAIRHDDAMDEDRKEAVREELFEGDHAWPHL